MNSNQKFVMVVALVAMAATTLVAPHRYTARWAIGSIMAQSTESKLRGTLYLSVWGSRSDVDVRTAIKKQQSPDGNDYIEGEVVELNTGLLGLWWAAIAAVTVVAVLLTKDTSEG